MPVPLENTIIVLIGFAGTGKYTIGRELCRRTGAKLVDNHLINNPIFTVVNADGVTPLPTGVWDKVKTIRTTVYEAIRELAPGRLSFVFTIELLEGQPEELKAFLDLAGLAAERRSLFVPVRLLCDVDELCHRVADPSRAAMLKAISPEHARKRMAEYSVLNPEHPHLCTIDVTHKSPDESADVILNHVQALSSGKSQND